MINVSQCLCRIFLPEGVLGCECPRQSLDNSKPFRNQGVGPNKYTYTDMGKLFCIINFVPRTTILVWHVKASIFFVIVSCWRIVWNILGIPSICCFSVKDVFKHHRNSNTCIYAFLSIVKSCPLIDDRCTTPTH